MLRIDPADFLADARVVFAPRSLFPDIYVSAGVVRGRRERPSSLYSATNPFRTDRRARHVSRRTFDGLLISARCFCNPFSDTLRRRCGFSPLSRSANVSGNSVRVLVAFLVFGFAVKRPKNPYRSVMVLSPHRYTLFSPYPSSVENPQLARSAYFSI